MPRYITEEDVRIRLIGKVRFTDDDSDENHMHTRLLRRLIDEAEGQVEMDLSPRYAAPFLTRDGAAFKTLPDRPTKEVIRTLCELKAVIRVLETDFGSGSNVNGEKYKKGQQDRYEAITKKLLEMRGEDKTGWKYPPLPQLRLNDHNVEADDGYLGQVLVTSDGDGAFPKDRINDPSESFFNARIPPEDAVN